MRPRSIVRGALLGAALLIPATAAQVAVAAPGASGVVVSYRAQSTTATVATPAGRLVAVHTTRVRPGTKVRVVKLRKLANGTLAGRVVVLGRSRNARVRGVVAGVIGNRGLAVSAPGTTVTLRVNGKRANEFGAPDLPGVGSTVSADVTITPKGGLDADKVEVVDDGTEAETFSLEGTVKAIGTGTGAPAVDPATGCATGLTSASLPQGWVAVTVGERGLRLTAFVRLPAAGGEPPVMKEAARSHHRERPEAPSDSATLAVGQEVHLEVSEIVGTNGQGCDNQFQMVEASGNSCVDEADDDDGEWHRHRGDRGFGRDGIRIGDDEDESDDGDV